MQFDGENIVVDDGDQCRTCMARDNCPLIWAIANAIVDLTDDWGIQECPGHVSRKLSAVKP